MSKPTKPRKTPRNPYALPAKQRKGGPHRNKADKRAKENKHPDWKDENR